jgi:hypothetical protein
MSATAFEFNRMTFDDAVEKVSNLLATAGLRPEGRIVTSRDPAIIRLAETLRIRSVFAAGFSRNTHLELEGPTRSTFTIAGANAHLLLAPLFDCASVQLIICGCAWVAGHELSAGDWCYVPPQVSCAIEVGRTGLMSVNVLVEDRCPAGAEMRRGARQASPPKP